MLTLAAAGVITGRVLDDFGDIVPGVHVMPMRYRTINGERQLMGERRTPGHLRRHRDVPLYGLAPGTYYVSARAEEMGRMGPAVTDATVTGFAPTFYPGTPVAAEAQPIEVVAGAEVVADVSLVAARLTSVSGIVVDPAGARATGGYVMTMQGGRSRVGMIGGSGGGSIKPDGTFTVSGLAPGEYVLQARPSFSANPMFEDATANRLERMATASVTVSGEPIVGPSPGRRGSDSHPGEPDLRGRVRAAPGTGVRLRRDRRPAWAAATPRFARTAGCRWRSCRDTYRLSAIGRARRGW